MRLTQKTEWIVIAAVIAAIAFAPKMDLLSTPVGKIAALAGIVYAWKCVSPIVAILLAVAFVSLAKARVWEGMAVSPASCACEDGYVYDASTKKCKNSTGASKDPTACMCDSGYAYDVITKQCTQASPVQEAIPAVSTAPVTTPGAAQAMATSTPPVAVPTSAGPTPSEKFDLMHAYPHQ